MKIIIGLSAACAVLGLAACGGGSSASSSAVTPSTVSTSTSAVNADPTVATSSPAAADLGKQYLALVAPANAAFDTAKAYFDAHPKVTVADEQTQLRPYADELQTFDNKVLRLPFTGQTATDIRTLVQNDAATIADIATMDATGDSQFITDDTKASAASNAVRADLGLAAAK